MSDDPTRWQTAAAAAEADLRAWRAARPNATLTRDRGGNR